MREYLKRSVPPTAESAEGVKVVVAEILEAVRRDGDAAVRRYSEKLDHWSPPSFGLSGADIEQAIASVSIADREKIDYSREQIARFARRQRESLSEFEIEQEPGVRLGQRLIPVDSVGAYVPGGRYPLVASALMSITTAKVAGVRRVIGCSPPAPTGQTGPGRSIYHFPLIRDLVVDMAPFVARMKAAGAAFVPRDPGARQVAPIASTGSERVVIDAAIECIGCGACVSACTMVRWDPRFPGPAALNRALTLVADRRDVGLAARWDALFGEDGVWRCHGQAQCTAVCPMELSPADSILRLRRKAVRSLFFGT